jgi:hypothetical protein
MFLVQILLPLRDGSGKLFPATQFSRVRDELTERFGGMTAYSRAPAEGLWDDPQDRRQLDDIVIYEVMADELDRPWWRSFRERLEGRFSQQELVIRSQEIERL